jgi:Ion channel
VAVRVPRHDCDGLGLDDRTRTRDPGLVQHRWGTPAGADRVYFAFVNYTTLGYGDITPVQDWRLLGPLTAMNGVMLFGWSSAVIFEVLRRTMRRVDLIDGPK